MLQQDQGPGCYLLAQRLGVRQDCFAGGGRMDMNQVHCGQCTRVSYSCTSGMRQWGQCAMGAG